MTQYKVKVGLKVVLCLVLCLALLELNRHRAAAQTNSAPAPAAVASPAAATPPSAAPSPASPPPAAPPAAPSQPAPASTATASPPPAPATIKVGILGLVKNSDPIVQAVMLFLLLCSAGSWAAFIYKSVMLAMAKRNTESFANAFRSAVTMDDAGAAVAGVADGAARRMWLAAKREWDLTLGATGTLLAADQTNRLLQRLALAMGIAQESSLSRLGNWMGLLATVGSTAPFIGLFGTVWGILDSFEHISASYNTSLNVVAPGIAEALLATAAGLFAAIPATMFYNRFAREIGKITGMLDNVTADLVVFASRDVERLHK